MNAAEKISDTLFPIPEFQELLTVIETRLPPMVEATSQAPCSSPAARQGQIREITEKLKAGRVSVLRAISEIGVSTAELLDCGAALEEVRRRLGDKVPISLAGVAEDQRRAGIAIALERSGMPQRFARRLSKRVGNAGAPANSECDQLLASGVIGIIVGIIGVAVFDYWVTREDPDVNKRVLAGAIIGEVIVTIIAAVNLDIDYKSCVNG